MSEEYVTKSGKVLTDKDLEALADEAEKGYEVSALLGVVETPLPGMPEPMKVTAYTSAIDQVHMALDQTQERLTELRKQREDINAEIKVLVAEEDLLERMSKIRKKQE